MAKQDVRIQLYMSEIEYDVRNKSYLAARALDSGENQKQVSDVQATEDPESRNLVLRCIGSGIARAKHMLSEWLGSGNVEVDNVQQEEDDVLNVSLKVPMNYNTGSTDELGQTLHSFLVSAALSEWFNVTDKQEASGWAERSSAELLHIKDVVHRRKRPTRPTGTIVVPSGITPSGGGSTVVTDDNIWHDDDIWQDSDTWVE